MPSCIPGIAVTPLSYHAVGASCARHGEKAHRLVSADSSGSDAVTADKHCDSSPVGPARA
ncbi:hypothetical protein DW322_16820 [Rhodococcus rhodnii]|uniref:Uncharacterized protein n=1 Tax=Rhodococcus rhodnii TaxID=38312 RepID=A0A6P2CI53_9NOCA|nr:hypothetical protein DW322_16820 [Rhodococcus rhodnii]